VNDAVNVPRGGSVWRAVEVAVRPSIPRDERWSFAVRQWYRREVFLVLPVRSNVQYSTVLSVCVCH
jgi:hypothetical protein